MTTPTIQIRRATRGDLDTIVSFNAAMAVETEAKTLDRDVLRRGVDAALANDDRCQYFLAVIDGDTVGQTMVTQEWSDWRNGFFWWIQSVYVDPAHRGCGVFRALYEHVRALAKNRSDICGVRLYVFKENHRAIETYRKLGMTLTDYLVCEETWPLSSPGAAG